jgi:hypothetical protein
MKKILVIIIAQACILSSASAQFGGLLGKAESAIKGGGAGISQDEAARAIKEALSNGVKTGVSKVSAADGYFANPAIKIPMPSEAKTVESALRGIGQGDLIDRTVLQINRSAEQAAVKAGPIFADAITKMSINDAMSIVSNKQQDACTQFLRHTTTEQLVVAFKPIIKTVLDETKTTGLWSEVMGTYNRIPFHSPVNTDLPDYVCRKAIDGLFYMIAIEEAKVRKDPMGQASDLIKKVFGSVR